MRMSAVQRGAPGGGTKQNDHGRRSEAARATSGLHGAEGSQRQHVGRSWRRSGRPPGLTDVNAALQGGDSANWLAPCGSTLRVLPSLGSRRKYFGTTRCGAAAGRGPGGPRGGHRMAARASAGPTAERKHEGSGWSRAGSWRAIQSRRGGKRRPRRPQEGAQQGGPSLHGLDVKKRSRQP